MTKKVLVIKASDPEVYDFYKESKSSFHQGDSGVDLYTPKDIIVNPGQTVLVDLGIQTEVQEYSDSQTLCKNLSYYLYPRSSIFKTPLMLANSVGIIDAGYRGNIKAAVKYIATDDDLQNIGKYGIGSLAPYTIKKGTRLFQICSNDLKPFSAVVFTDELTESTRGEGGFGSTGI